jgi:hypothetical protein
MQVLREDMDISMILAQQTIRHTTTGCNDAKNSDINVSP